MNMNNVNASFNDGKVHYFRLMNNLPFDLGCYVNAPIYDDNPSIGSYCSTLGVERPKQHDFLIYNDGEITFDSSNKDFDGVCFSRKSFINIKELLNQQIIVEVSLEDYNSFMSLEIEIDELDKEQYNEETAVDFYTGGDYDNEKERQKHQTKLDKINEKIQAKNNEYAKLENKICA